MMKNSFRRLFWKSSRGAMFLFATGVLLAGCGERADTVVEGKMSIVPMMGPDQLMIEYEPGREAVIYTSDRTEFVNVVRAGPNIAYQPGVNYRITGNKTHSVFAEKTEDGMVPTRKLNSTDLWIDAIKVELLETEQD